MKMMLSAKSSICLFITTTPTITVIILGRYSSMICFFLGAIRATDAEAADLAPPGWGCGGELWEGRGVSRWKTVRRWRTNVFLNWIATLECWPIWPAVAPTGRLFEEKQTHSSSAAGGGVKRGRPLIVLPIKRRRRPDGRATRLGLTSIDAWTQSPGQWYGTQLRALPARLVTLALSGSTGGPHTSTVTATECRRGRAESDGYLPEKTNTAKKTTVQSEWFSAAAL